MGPDRWFRTSARSSSPAPGAGDRRTAVLGLAVLLVAGLHPVPASAAAQAPPVPAAGEPLPAAGEPLGAAPDPSTTAPEPAAAPGPTAPVGLAPEPTAPVEPAPGPTHEPAAEPTPALTPTPATPVAPEPTAAASAVLATALADGWYRAPHSTAIVRVTAGRSAPATFAQWSAAGQPAPTEAPTTYVKHSWAPQVHAVTTWPDGTVTEKITGEQWQRSGYRPVTAVGSVPGTTYHQWGTSAEVFAVPPASPVHRLTGPQWREAGSPAPERRSTRGWVRLSWDDAIGYAPDLARLSPRPVTFAEWTAAGSPTPQTHARMPGDRFFTYPGAPPVYYEGPLAWGPVTARQWAAAGSPSPQVL